MLASTSPTVDRLSVCDVASQASSLLTCQINVYFLYLLLLGRQDEADAMLAALEVLIEPFRSMAITLVDVCAYAGNVLTALLAAHWLIVYVVFTMLFALQVFFAIYRVTCSLL